jgi:antirestriction protein ArdC
MTNATSKTPRIDLYQRVTDEIVRAIEAGAGPFIMPWHGLAHGRPRNPYSGEAYRGINTLVLWAAARNQKYVSAYWATYRQWRYMKAQVREGEKATMVVLYKQVPIEAEDAQTGELVQDYRFVARAYFVFNAEQVEGWQDPGHPLSDAVVTHQEVDEFIAATGADVRYAGDRAAYLRVGDYIMMPSRERFAGTDTSSATECYYSTLFHELVHWTGHWTRLNRHLTARFATADYAMEELIAELGAAYLSAELLLLHMPRKDHAAYIEEWLNVLKGDKRAIFTASRAAQEAVDFLLAR